MTASVPVMVSWSSGKDSAWALHTLRQQPERYDVRGMFTTVTTTFDRISIHATPRWVLKLQSERLGLPLYEIPIPSPCTNAQYEAFGDLFLEDIRRYREDRLGGTGFTPLFPVWGNDTSQLAETMIAAGVRAIITAGDARLPSGMVGRWFDRSFLADLPDGIDPLGENGEFHTCVIDGPMFTSPIRARPGQVVQREIPPVSDEDGIHAQSAAPTYVTYADIVAL